MTTNKKTNILCEPQMDVPDGHIVLSGDLEHDSIVNGPGLRAVLWTQGCRQHCPGCQNPETWAEKDVGAVVEIEKVKDELRKLNHGFSIRTDTSRFRRMEIRRGARCTHRWPIHYVSARPYP